MSDAPVKLVTVLGKQWAINLPGFSAREEAAAAWSEHREDGLMLRRVYAAIVGLCTPLGGASRASYGRAGCSVLVYGGEVYDYLRAQGASVEDVCTAGAVLLAPLLDGLFPREQEVADKAGFTEAGEGAAT